MKKSTPPAEVLNKRPGRRSLFDGIAEKLRADLGAWYDITDELDTPAEKSTGYLYELARAVTNGGRNSFKPRGAFEGACSDTKLWARYVGEPTPADTDIPDDDPADVVVTEA